MEKLSSFSQFEILCTESDFSASDHNCELSFAMQSEGCQGGLLAVHPSRARLNERVDEVVRQ